MNLVRNVHYSCSKYQIVCRINIISNKFHLFKTSSNVNIIPSLNESSNCNRIIELTSPEKWNVVHRIFFSSNIQCCDWSLIKTFIKMFNSFMLSCVPIWIAGNITCCIDSFLFCFKISISFNTIIGTINELLSIVYNWFNSCCYNKYISWDLSIIKYNRWGFAIFILDIFDSCPIDHIDAMLYCQLFQCISNIFSNYMLKRKVHFLYNWNINGLFELKFNCRCSLHTNKSSPNNCNIFNTILSDCLIDLIIVLSIS